MLSRKAEDYLEAILTVIEDKGYARIKDIAERMDVKPPSAVEMARKLDDRGLITYRKYDGITLTKVGAKRAHAIKERHETIRRFLEVIRVPADIADKDACIMEHHLDESTLEQLRKFLKFIESSPGDPKWLEHFKVYCETGLHQCEQEAEGA